MREEGNHVGCYLTGIGIAGDEIGGGFSSAVSTATCRVAEQVTGFA
jgi:hypothetical protein